MEKTETSKLSLADSLSGMPVMPVKEKETKKLEPGTYATMLDQYKEQNKANAFVVLKSDSSYGYLNSLFMALYMIPSFRRLVISLSDKSDLAVQFKALFIRLKYLSLDNVDTTVGDLQLTLAADRLFRMGEQRSRSKEYD